MQATLFKSWRDAFLDVIQEPLFAAPLKTASLAEDLQSWTTHLTSAVVTSCHHLDWNAAAKGHLLHNHPKPGKEYLNIDVMAFPATSTGRWRLPIAAFELENNRSDDRVGYSLWKLLCLRANLRVVFAFRRDWSDSRQSVESVCSDVIGSLTVADRMLITGETVLIVGNRGDGESFPWGFFKAWMLDVNLGRFEKIS